MASLQYGSCFTPSMYHILSKWRACLLCRSFHVPSNRHSGRKLLFSVNDLSHFEQVKGFSPVWVLSYIFNGLLPVNDLSHFEQVKGLSPEWVLSCFFNGRKFFDFFVRNGSWWCWYLETMLGKGDFFSSSSRWIPKLLKIVFTLKFYPLHAKILIRHGTAVLVKKVKRTFPQWTTFCEWLIPLKTSEGRVSWAGHIQLFGNLLENDPVFK